MPVADGYALTRYVKEHYAGIPVVMLSGRSENEEEAIKAGVDVFLEKPVDALELADTVNKLLGNNSLI